MAHACAYCGGDCHCSGDIDDVVVNETPITCRTCGCELDPADDQEFEDDMDPVGYECVGCLLSQGHPGDCPICGSELEPYG